MFKTLKEIAAKLIKSRLFVFTLIVCLMFGILIQRIFYLQIVKGQDYADKYTLKIEKERSTTGTRGNIYDCNGKLLAYNELSYSVILEDSGYYASDKIKNISLNAEIHEIVKMIESNGDSLTNDFNIVLNDEGKFEFTVSGTSLQRFRADVYGYTTIDELTKNKNKLGYEEAEATAQQVIDFLRGNKKFCIRMEGVDEPTEDDIKYEREFYSQEDAYKILVVRYALSQNNFQKYIYTTIAKGVSDETVAAIKENADRLEGVDIMEDTIRKYANSEYFSHIIGYTGKISQAEYDELVEENEDYTLTDIVGKSGIEQAMESVLQGSKGYEKFYVDNMGRVVEMKEYVEAASGNDVYLSIDSDLQMVVYDLLEQEIAGIVYSKIRNIKEYTGDKSSDIVIPIDDVYFALINNNVIDINAFGDEDASDIERTVYHAFQSRQESALSQINSQLNSASPAAYEDLSKEMQVYMSYILTLLTSNKILDTSAINTDDQVYKNWKNDKISLAEYLQHAIAEEWIDITRFETESKYSDSMEIYNALCKYIQEELKNDKGFNKKIYKYMIRDNIINGKQICMILYDQGVLSTEDEDYGSLSNGSMSAYDFIRKKIKNLEITPAQLALDPCTGSCVVINPQSGQLLACVTYPGYDTNRLANNMDSAYYYSLQMDLTSPMYSNATQQRTAPGSTFKPVTAVAALTEGLITTSTTIADKGVFELVQNGPKCWVYPGNHGVINVSEAIRDSCNYFFYTLGYNMSLSKDTYQEKKGIATLEKYAKMFGFSEKTGIEVPENEPQISNEFPITSAIGQGNHNYTTISLARYTAAIANSGTVYQLTLLDKVTDSEGNLIQDYGPSVYNTLDEVSSSTWDAIHSGMRMVAQENTHFKDFSIAAAGKTGTAQQVSTRPNHALFIGYAPYDDPEIALTTRIAYGYTSSNSAEVSRKVMEYYFKITDKDELINGQAQDVGNSANGFTD